MAPPTPANQINVGTHNLQPRVPPPTVMCKQPRITSKNHNPNITTCIQLALLSFLHLHQYAYNAFLLLRHLIFIETASIRTFNIHYSYCIHYSYYIHYSYCIHYSCYFNCATPGPSMYWGAMQMLYPCATLHPSGTFAV